MSIRIPFKIYAEQILISVVVACISISWLWPIRGVVWQDFNQELSIFLGLIILVSVLLPKKTQLTWSIGFTLTIGLLPLIQISTGTIIFSGDGWLTTFYLICFSASVIVGFNLSQRDNGRRLIRVFCMVVLVLSLLSALIALRQWFGVADSIWEIDHRGARPYANLAQPNHLASLLCFGIISVIYFYNSHILNRFTSSALAFLLILGSVVTQSRTVWVVAGTLLALWLWYGSKLDLRLSVKTFTVWVLAFVSATMLLPVLADVMALPAHSLGDRVSASARLDIWGAVLKIIVDSPLMGFGWGQIPIAQVDYFDVYPIHGGLLTYSHNLFLDLLLWNGIWIGGAIILFIIAWEIRLLRSIATPDAFIALLMVVVFFTHAMFEYPHAYSYFLLPAGLMLGAAEGCSRRSVISLSFPIWLRIIIGIASACLMLLIVNEYRYFEKNDFNRRITQANVIGFDQVDLGRDVLILTQLDALQWFQRFEPTAKATDAELGKMADVVARYPFLSNIYRYALALAASGRIEQAAQELKLLKVIHGQSFYERALDQIETELGAELRGTLAEISGR